jgi:hypothetical protein
MFNQEAQLSTNLILNDEIIYKKISVEKIHQMIKDSNRRKKRLN